MNQILADAKLKVKVHNWKQNVESLRKRRKHLRGKINKLRTETEQAEKSLRATEDKLADAKCNLRAMRGGNHDHHSEPI